ncbi:uncharacterized protein LOC144908146 [Branchiostoma floridae x Branchiostoma belcheri]
MSELVWLLVLCPWLVHSHLGQTTTGSPTTNSWTCPESYAWDNATHECIPCSVCIRYPQSSFCSECSEFIFNVPGPVPTPHPLSPVVPASLPDSELNLDSSDEQPPPPPQSNIWIFVIAGATTAIGSLLISTVVLRFWKAAIKRKKLRKKNRSSPPKLTFSDVETRELNSLDERFYSSEITSLQMPVNDIVQIHVHHSDSDISLGNTARSIADGGSSTKSSTSATTSSNNDSTIPTVSQVPLKKSVHFVPDRHMSDSDSDISLGISKTGSSSSADTYACRGYSTTCNIVSQMSQWEESCAESSDSVCSTDKSTVATSDCNSVAEALIGRDGGILMLPNAATSLLFSPHSISNQIDITLEILNNPVVLPELREDETLVSTCVFCGPHSWTFHKPVLLTFPHCGMSDRDDFTLLVTETSSQQAPDWMEVSSDTPGIEYFVRDSECLVYTSHFTGFSLKSKGPKQVRLLAFSSLSDNLYRLRVYCISDTKDVVDRIKKEEQEFGFKQTDRGVSMTFLNNKHNLHLRAHLETPGWKFLNSSELVISYESVRRKRDSNVLFKLQAEPEHKKGTAILSLSICAFQDGNSDSPTYSIAEELPVAQGQTEMRKLGPTSCDHKGACNCKTLSQVYMVHSADITNQAFLNSLGSHRSRHLTIPHKLRTQLCIKLDPPKYCGDDWRSLASELGLDELIEYFSSKENPTELVLQEFDKTGKTLKDLRAILIGIGRPDAAYLVQEHLQTTNHDLPSPSNDSGVGSPDTDTSERDSTPSPGSDKMFFPNSPSQSGEQNSTQYMPHGESVPSNEMYNSHVNTEASERSIRMSQDDVECTELMVVSISGREVVFPEGCCETAV